MYGPLEESERRKIIPLVKGHLKTRVSERRNKVDSNNFVNRDEELEQGDS